MIALTAHYGLRRSEVLGLKWSAIDFEGDMIHVRHKVLGTPEGPVGYDVMKTVSSHRALGLSAAIKALLLEEREKQKERAKVLGNAYCRKDADYACLNALGELFTPDYVSNRFATILKQNGLKHIRFHDLRHSCASLLVAKGVQMKLIQQWLGHSNISTTANIYSHVDGALRLFVAPSLRLARKDACGIVSPTCGIFNAAEVSQSTPSAKAKGVPDWVPLLLWRRRWDLNPRAALTAYEISSHASSTT